MECKKVQGSLELFNTSKFVLWLCFGFFLFLITNYFAIRVTIRYSIKSSEKKLAEKFKIVTQFVVLFDGSSTNRKNRCLFL